MTGRILQNEALGLEQERISLNSPDPLDPKHLQAYIRSQVWKLLYLLRGVVPPELLEDEIDDLTQIAWLKFWLISQRETITNQNGYIRSIVRSLMIDTRRRHKLTGEMLLDEYGEVAQGHVLISGSMEMMNPADEFERTQELADCIEEVLDDILALPPCQRRAVLCMLKDELDDIEGLAEALWKRGIDIERMSWPQDKRALQRCRASLFIARQKFRSMKKKYVRV